MEAKIYVEGINDLVFLGTYLQTVMGFQGDNNPKGRIHLFKKEGRTVQLLELGGYSNLNTTTIKEDIEDDLEDGIKSLVILDTDTIYNDGGFSVRTAAVDTIKVTVPFEYFLIPNAQDDGYLETLLGNILVEEYQASLQCFRDQDQCLKQTNSNLLTGKKLKVTPEKAADKAALNSFMRRLENKGKDKFKDQTIWNLHHPYLDPLKTFLEKHLL
ncbi:MAG: DUF3226 domain-containing protein [Aureispira sp.]